MKTEAHKPNIPFGRPMLGPEEHQAVMEVLRGPMLVHGPRVNEFEEHFAQFTGAPYAVAVSSCTAGLHLAYLYLGIGAGDEVIVPAQTHTATAHAVEYCGATPVFVDAELKTGNLNIEQIEVAITPRTKAISVVHYLGTPVDMKKVMTIADRHNLFVVEDSALAIGTYLNGVHAGLHGHVGTFSFYPVKHMTTAEGGMLITKDSAIADRVKKLRAFGLDKTVNERHLPGIYDVTMLGYNFRMNELQSALGIEQLKKVPDFLQKRHQNSSRLRGLLQAQNSITLLSDEVDDGLSSHYCLTALLDDSLGKRREELVTRLKSAGIGTSVYYPRPVPHLDYYQTKYRLPIQDYPNAAKISYESIALPVGPHIQAQDIDYIADNLIKTVQEMTDE